MDEPDERRPSSGHLGDSPDHPFGRGRSAGLEDDPHVLYARQASQPADGGPIQTSETAAKRPTRDSAFTDPGCSGRRGMFQAGRRNVAW